MVAKLQGDRSAFQSSMELYDPLISAPFCGHNRESSFCERKRQGNVMKVAPMTVMEFSALGKWGHTHMGSDGLNWILLFGPVRVRLVPLKTHDFKRFRPDFNRRFSGFQGIWLKSGLKLLDALLGRPHLPGAELWLQTISLNPALWQQPRQEALGPNSQDTTRRMPRRALSKEGKVNSVNI